MKLEGPLFSNEEARIMYNAQGEAELLLIPLRAKPVYDISDDEIVTAVRQAREKVFQQLYGKNKKATGAS